MLERTYVYKGYERTFIGDVGVSLTESSVHLSCSTYWFTIH